MRLTLILYRPGCEKPPVADKLSLPQIIGCQAGVFGYPREHLRADFFAIVKGKNEIRPTHTTQDSV
jgi:hypothetical protein